MIYLAHKDGEREQTLKDHLSETARLSGEFAEAFGASGAGKFCGKLHDVGKYCDGFQRRIRGAKQSVDHSTAGAIEAKNRGNYPAAFCIAGHHAGLPDRGDKASRLPESPTLLGRLCRKVGRDIEEYGAYRDEIEVPGCEIPERFRGDSESLAFFTRMLFSCLVDADWLDTENSMDCAPASAAGPDASGARRGGFEPLAAYERKLMNKLSPWLRAPAGTLGALRSEILGAAMAAARLPPGLFSLTAPTGSGKTLSSMAFALSHAREGQKRRIIYVIPYCSIIEQTQAVFEGVFGPGSVVAHYANVDYKTPEGDADRRYLSAENWDAPVILTTTVQFFESLYANRPSRCRKLHNIANSVIIFDEAQMLPAPFLRPCVHAIAQLVAHYGCSALLCTATQPALGPLFSEMLASHPIREICPRPLEMYRLFRRVRYESLGVLSEEALSHRLAACEQALCVVNRRDQAQTLYDALPEEGRFHLTTALCPAHRREHLETIRKRLREGQVCRVVSTSLVEAGVDLDFPTVFRALSGLDSVIQAGGRCNREGKAGLEDSVVYIFESDRPAPRMLSQNLSCARRVLDRYPDPGAPEAIAAYFNDLFYVAKGMGALDEKKILPRLQDGTYPFRKIAEEFLLIEKILKIVYIPCQESEAPLERLAKYGPSRSLMRELGAYAVGVYPNHYGDLLRTGAVREIADGAGVLEDGRLYSRDKGLSLSIEEGISMFS